MVLFYVATTVILLNVILGVIVDTFGQIRDKRAETEQDKTAACFVSFFIATFFFFFFFDTFLRYAMLIEKCSNVGPSISTATPKMITTNGITCTSLPT
jgi:hypothetical protein